MLCCSPWTRKMRFSFSGSCIFTKLIKSFWSPWPLNTSIFFNISQDRVLLSANRDRVLAVQQPPAKCPFRGVADHQDRRIGIADISLHVRLYAPALHHSGRRNDNARLVVIRNRPARLGTFEGKSGFRSRRVYHCLP